MSMKQKRFVLALLMFFAVASAQADVDARIYWGKRIEMGVPVSGVVEKVPVETGVRVKKGGLLLSLEQTPFRTALVEAKAELAQASGHRKELRRDFNQAKELFDRGLTSSVEYENASLKKENSEAAYSAARARLQRAEYELSRSSLRAPFDGLVLNKNVEAGQALISAQKVEIVITFVAAGDYIARGLISGKKLEGLEIGKKATVRVSGKKYAGTLSALGLEPVSSKKTSDPKYEVSVRFSSSAVLLRAGMEAEIEF